jgi:ABC-type sulfate/molybdate transport systems ATPase subunit
MTVLDASVTGRRGDFTLEASLSASAGEVIALVGPNGAGKSTLLRLIAGLAPADGFVRIDDADVSAASPERRPVGWVPQQGALFPHLNAVDNVAFGIGGRRGRAQSLDWLERLGIADLAARKPAQLSGGQAQKVALARALARNPRVLLLDEPLAALDAVGRTDVRRTLRTHLSSFEGVTIAVTHDAVDVATIADRIIAIDAGRVVQDDAVAEAMRRPRTRWLASMLGSNACHGRSRAGGIDVDGGGRLVAPDVPTLDNTEVLVVFAPHSITLHPRPPEGRARNTWQVVVQDLVDAGGRVRVDADGAPSVVAEVTPAAVADLGLHEGAVVWVSVKATELTIVPL